MQCNANSAPGKQNILADFYKAISHGRQQDQEGQKGELPLTFKFVIDDITHCFSVKHQNVFACAFVTHSRHV